MFHHACAPRFVNPLTHCGHVGLLQSQSVPHITRWHSPTDVLLGGPAGGMPAGQGPQGGDGAVTQGFPSENVASRASQAPSGALHCPTARTGGYAFLFLDFPGLLLLQHRAGCFREEGCSTYCAHGPVCVLAAISSGYTPTTGIVPSQGKSTLKLLRNYPVHCHSSCTSLQFHQKYTRIPISSSTHQHSFCFKKKKKVILIDLKWYLIVVLTFIFLMINDIQHLFICFMHLCIFFAEMSFQIFCPF